MQSGLCAEIIMKINSKPGPLMAPLPAVMVSCGDIENSNIITIAWTGIINSNPPMTYISVAPSRYSHDIIEERGEFVINLTDRSLAKSMDFCGVRSGRKLDKFLECGLHKEAGDAVSAPMIAEAPVSIECRVIEMKSLPSHDMFIAEILAVHIDESFVDESGAYDYSRMELVAFSHGRYYGLSQHELGFFGYSVMKPATARKRRKAAKGLKRSDDR